jgi:RNA polymerase sigma-70 factor (ECF subfamily)
MIDWAEIVAEHGSTVWRTVYRLVNHYDDALDCYQEVFLAALKVSRRETVGDWPSLLASLAARRAMDRLRLRYRNRRSIVAFDHASEPVCDRSAPDSEADASELMERLRVAMAALPQKQAEVFWLSCIEGLSHQKISDRMQITAGEARVLLHRARLRLRVALGSEELDEEQVS